MNKKIISLSIALALVAGTFASCAPKQGTSQAPTNTSSTATSTKSDAPVTLRFSWWGGDERNAATQEVIDQFMELNPNVTIEAEFGGNDGYHDKLATQLASGTAADIVQVDPEIFPTYVNTGDYFLDYKEQKVDLSNFDEAYISLSINGRYDGKQLGLPTGISGAGIIVNKELAEKADVDLTKPFTWEDLITMGKKVREYDKDVYLLCANKEYIANLVIFNYAKQLMSKPLFDADTKTVNFTQAQLEEVYSYVERLYTEGVVAPASYQAPYSGDNLQSDSKWIAGKYVAALSYVSTVDVMVAANPEIEYYLAQLPVLSGATEKGWVSNTPQVLAITKSCKAPEVAAAFMDYFFNNETALATLGCTRSVPPTGKAREICTEKGVLSKHTMAAADIAASLGGTPNDKISSSPEAKAILFDSVEAIGYGASNPKTAAENAVNLLTALVK